jgi:hypothetical protein
MVAQTSGPRRPSDSVAPPCPLDRHSIRDNARSRAFFAEPGEQPLPFDDWITVWKSGVTRILREPEWRWQAGSFHHRIRSYEDYNEKLNYMRENPV